MDGEFKFEEITAGDCVGNYTVGGWDDMAQWLVALSESIMETVKGSSPAPLISGTFSCVDVEVVFSGSTFSAFAKYYLPSILLVSPLSLFISLSLSRSRSLSLSRSLSSSISLF